MDEKLKMALEREYGIKNIESIELIKEGISNLNYKILTRDRSYVARVCRFEPDNQLRVMLPFLVFAEKNELPAARLIKTLDNKFNIQIDDEPVVVTTFIQGLTLKPEEVSWSNLNSLAESVEKLHSMDWQPETNSKTLHPYFILDIYSEWEERLFSESSTLPEQLQYALAADYKTFSNDNFLSKFNSLPQRVVHGDLIPGNVIFDEEGSVEAIVDFEEIGRSTRLLDLARIITTWFFVEGHLSKENMDSFMDTYAKLDPLNSEEKDMFNQIVHYVTFRHAVFVSRMLIQSKIDSLENNNEIVAYLSCANRSNVFLLK